MQLLGSNEPPDYLIRLLMVVERAERNFLSEDEGPPLSRLIRSNAKLQRTLFWADVREQRNNAKEGRQANCYWQIIDSETKLWEFGIEDLSWLYEDLSQSTVEADQLIALDAIVSVLKQFNRLKAEAAHLRKLVHPKTVLKKELEKHLTPPSMSEEGLRFKQKIEENHRRQAEKKEKDMAAWVDFQRSVQGNPNLLFEPRYLRNWKAGAYRLWNLTEWLQYLTDTRPHAVPRQWRLLEEGFGRQVAEAYRDGMKVLWRLIKPARPTRSKDGTFTINRSNILAFGAVGLEAAEDPDWRSRLSDNEAKRAALHGCLTEEDFPEWIESLLCSHPHIIIPILKRRIRHEWLSPSNNPSDFLNHFAKPALKIQPGIQQILYQTIAGNAPLDLGKLDLGVRIIKKLDLGLYQIRKIMRIARCRLSKHASEGNTDFALRYLLMLFLLEPDQAIPDFENWLGSENVGKTQPHTERTFSFLFDRRDPILSDALATASVSTLEKLLRLAYFYIRPEQDIIHEGGFSPELRDHAQDARNIILDAILNRPGADAYRALQHIANDPEYALRADRFRELAHGKAEQDAELPAWTEKEVVNFERKHTAPVKTGNDLLRVVMGVLEEIQFQLHQSDVSSRQLLQRALNEDEVRNWIVEQMNLRSRGRYHTYREAQVAGKKEPDIIVSSTAAQCEVVIEVKHGGKKWTFRQLEYALRRQLATAYLRPYTRRHGVLVATCHGARKWRDPDTRKMVSFDSLISRLDNIANTIIENESGAIEVKCFGINASPLK